MIKLYILLSINWCLCGIVLIKKYYYQRLPWHVILGEILVRKGEPMILTASALHLRNSEKLQVRGMAGIGQKAIRILFFCSSMDQIEPKKKVYFFSIFMQYIHWYTVLDPLHLIVPHDAFHQLMPTKEWYNFFFAGKRIGYHWSND
jgi:hypothetical protein